MDLVKGKIQCIIGLTPDNISANSRKDIHMYIYESCELCKIK